MNKCTEHGAQLMTGEQYVMPFQEVPQGRLTTENSFSKGTAPTEPFLESKRKKFPF